jgi:hypothetical protein
MEEKVELFYCPATFPISSLSSGSESMSYCSLSPSTLPPSFLLLPLPFRMPFPAISYPGNGMYAHLLLHTSCPSAQKPAPYTPHPIPSLPQLHAYLSDHLLSCGEDACPMTAHAPLGSLDEVMQVAHFAPVVRSFPVKCCVEVSVDEQRSCSLVWIASGWLYLGLLAGGGQEIGQGPQKR